ncbi:hypothetical protein HRG_003668 [Hirsutella rhossiliensis]|uniref:Uncharacterized protein n=1 Tax=Hirsutella rhossiliensis TaxID=111463 RepID=A0A9P8N6Q1_9HYPO|nr:uncharacterized protein HRG_03668 [Hirsutella rhossiliensis]KAH0965652.1 hypothetical protein HRG_03668 [Hirsutella rhossiliensis]
MAQVGDTEASLGTPDAAPRKLTDQEAYEIQQYAKIVRFRDAVFSGAHPTIKLPNLASSLPLPSPRAAATAVPLSQGNGAPLGILPSSRPTNAKDQDAAKGTAIVSSAIPKPFASGQTEINPILLEKSDELIRAEVALQRQRLERALRDEVEQRRSAKTSQSERYTDLDISDVLAKALTLVPQTAAPSPVGEDLTANHDAASDSFDEKTFYSSQHDTPQSQMTSRVRNDSTVDETQHGRAQAVVAPEPPAAIPTRQKDSQHGGLSANPVVAAPLANVVPGLNNYVGAGAVATPPSQNTASGAQSQSEDSANLELDAARVEVARSHTQLQRNSYVDLHPPSPLIRGHALQPVAPQPAQISPLAVPGQGHDGPSQAVPRTRGTPAPDSSSQGGRASEKRKSKRKKRKADRQAPEVEANPCIKVEPRSASPLTAPSYVRANKRQRQSQGQAIELEYESSYERPLVHGPDGQYLTRQYRDEQVSLGYDSARAHPQRAVSTALIGDQRYGREYLDERRLPADGHVRGYGLPGPVPPYPYSPRMAYPPRPVSQVFAGDGYREPPRSFRDAYAGQPKPPQPRMLVDAFGREYFDPSHPAVHRPNAPSVGPGEPGLVYERLPPRAVSRHPGPEPRVVTQPAEYAPYEYRDGRHREYQPRPMAPPGEFMEVGDRRPVNEAPGGYATRAASMMPVEAVRYEVPQAYGRMQSVRPEIPGHEYAPGVHAEGRREAAQPYVREYAARPTEPYHRPQAPRADEIAFIERPRGATQEIVYADDARREVYR